MCFFWGGRGQFFGGDIKVFSGRWVEGNKVVCLKTRTLLTCLLGKKSDVVEFCIWGREFCVFFGGGGGRFFGGRYRDSFLGGIKFWEGEVFRGRHKGFFGQVGGENKVVCLKTRTLPF